MQESSKCRVPECFLKTSIGFDGLCGAHYVWFLHYKEGNEACDCPPCEMGRSKIEATGIHPHNFTLTPSRSREKKIAKGRAKIAPNNLLNLKWIK